jgi:hypothetical protein
VTPTDDLRLTLRMNLDETIPPGGTDADTMFTDAEIDNLLTQSQTIEEASWRGWVVKCMRLTLQALESGGGALVQFQMGSEQFKWSEGGSGNVGDICKSMIEFWWNQIPAGMVPTVGSGGARILSIQAVPMPGINTPYYTPSDPNTLVDPWIGSGSTPWLPSDPSRLLAYIKAGWRWPSAETYVATVPEK